LGFGRFFYDPSLPYILPTSLKKRQILSSQELFFILTVEIVRFSFFFGLVRMSAAWYVLSFLLSCFASSCREKITRTTFFSMNGLEAIVRFGIISFL